jgi:TatA/E family protein of Tat protein translocase
MTGWGEWIVIVAVILLVWNARKIPALGSALGESIRSFRKGLKDEKKLPREVHEIRNEATHETKDKSRP